MKSRRWSVARPLMSSSVLRPALWLDLLDGARQFVSRLVLVGIWQSWMCGWPGAKVNISVIGMADDAFISDEVRSDISIDKGSNKINCISTRIDGLCNAKYLSRRMSFHNVISKPQLPASTNPILTSSPGINLHRQPSLKN